MKKQLLILLLFIPIELPALKVTKPSLNKSKLAEIPPDLQRMILYNIAMNKSSDTTPQVHSKKINLIIQTIYIYLSGSQSLLNLIDTHTLNTLIILLGDNLFYSDYQEALNSLRNPTFVPTQKSMTNKVNQKINEVGDLWETQFMSYQNAIETANTEEITKQIQQGMPLLTFFNQIHTSRDLKELAIQLINDGIIAPDSEIGNQNLLSWATTHIEPDLVKALINAKVDFRKLNPNKSTPLFGTYDPELITLLIQKGVNINAQDDLGNTALIYAIQNGYPQAIKILLAAGANPNLKNKWKKTASDIAQKSYNKDIRLILETATKNIQAQEAK